MKLPKIIVPLVYLAIFCWNLLTSSCSTSTTQESGNTSEKKDTLVGFCTDKGGNQYKTIKIGTQTWMAEDLRNNKIECNNDLKVIFSDGLERGPGVAFYDTLHPHYAFYDNKDLGNKGIIYNYRTIQNCAICPEGFRIPTKADWEELIEQLGGLGVAGKRLLTGGDSGFNATLNGRIDSYGSGLQNAIGFWWSIDRVANTPKKEAYSFEVNNLGIVKIKGQDTRVGNHVRCIKMK
ncbi:FISUMP domain-containing protein [Haliscomenobacter sp.]|uniref:FISUMP domain-containing protein n=1 Tax=Haliscomenobacter sp. TaxID=2717303 RepID=UPI003BAD44F7